MIHPKVKFTQGKNCQLHANAKIGFNENGQGTIVLGNRVVIRNNCLLRTCGGRIEIGDAVVINYGFICHGMGNIQIGDFTLISPNVQMYAQNHCIVAKQLIKNQTQTGKGITIREDCWIGAGSIILDGVVIEEGAVIGAGSVVTKNIPSYEIWAGNPAKKIGVRK